MSTVILMAEERALAIDLFCGWVVGLRVCSPRVIT